MHPYFRDKLGFWEWFCDTEDLAITNVLRGNLIQSGGDVVLSTTLLKE